MDLLHDDCAQRSHALHAYLAANPFAARDQPNLILCYFWRLHRFTNKRSAGRFIYGIHCAGSHYDGDH